MNSRFKKLKIKAYALIVVLTLILTLASSYTFAASNIDVLLIKDSQQKHIETSVETVEEMLKEFNISLKANDSVFPSLSTVLEDGMKVIIETEKDVVINAGGVSYTFKTAEEVNKDFMIKNNITVGELDYIDSQYDELNNTLTVNLIKVEEKEIYVTESIPCSVVNIENPYLYEGQSVKVKDGKNGTKKTTYKVRYENGKETSRISISEETVAVPVDTLVEVGTGKLPENSIMLSDGKVLNYSKAIMVNASAYDLSFASCGKRPGDRGYGITASGMRAAYGVVAVDPKVIPLGTKLYITSTDGSWTYGEAIAGDTGGAIKGNRVDLFFNTYSECISFGRKTAMVYILS